MGKKCPSCGVVKDTSSFDLVGSDPHRLQTRCRECTTKIWLKVVGSRLQSLAKLKQENREAYDKLVVSTLYSNASKRARKVGTPFTISKTDIVLVDKCPIMGCDLVLSTGKQSNDSYSLDRIDSTRGYVPGNVRVISWRANFLKQSLTLEQAKALVTYMEGK